MGMQFSPMYQPVSTKTIKADGDLNLSPYDLIAYDGKFDTVEADEFVGGVGNFTSGLFGNISSNYIGLYGNVTDTQTSYTYATCPSYNLTQYGAPTEVVIPANYVYNLPIKLSDGVYITGTRDEIPQTFTTTLNLTVREYHSIYNNSMMFYYKKEGESDFSSFKLDATNGPRTFSMEVETNSILTYYMTGATTYINGFYIAEGPTYYLTLESPSA